MDLKDWCGGYWVSCDKCDGRFCWDSSDPPPTTCSKCDPDGWAKRLAEWVAKHKALSDAYLKRTQS